jgi:hypothetical protein
MITKGSIECPFCRRPFRAWFQTGVKTVMCPTCWAEVATADVEVEPAPVRPAWRNSHLASVWGLIWDRLVGYNARHPDELTL